MLPRENANRVHWIAEDSSCAVCGTAEEHRTWVEARLAEIASRPLTPWHLAMKAKIDAAREKIEKETRA